jgi:methionine-R-sulfoxide reductase
MWIYSAEPAKRRIGAMEVFDFAPPGCSILLESVVFAHPSHHHFSIAGIEYHWEWLLRDRQPPKREEQPMHVKVYNRKGQLVGPINLAKVVKTDAEWSKQLTPAQFLIARGKGTERPFCGTLLDNKRHGVYACVCCGLPLFASNSKFHSGTGWPSFFQPVAAENVATENDRSHGMARTEILCARCDAHLGHVFPDGPPPTHLRYCVNSESLAFTDEKDLANLADPAAERPIP